MSILQPLDTAALLDAGLVTPPSSTGTRRLHRRRVNNLSEILHDLTGSPPLSTDFTDDNCFAAIPDVLLSETALRNLGYRPDIAADMWTRRVDWAPGSTTRVTDPDDGLIFSFLEFATGHAHGRGRDMDATFENTPQEWHACLDACGINSETQEALMDPLYADIRESASCVDWIIDTIELRFRALQQVRAASLDRERILQEASTRPSGSE
ncbi:hypothetical protein VHEMI07982 [[Torrubiella] hemipterigena]|uniref:Uncharacterized protein n=1 Tax=[Torrubiella] hemipterigena TaxID=1531966 RepID=A0A0A1TNW1_9HYPO|nr:hypothetical protein VHEMI07982 [[Torrubiella] hemipterigena]